MLMPIQASKVHTHLATSAAREIRNYKLLTCPHVFCASCRNQPEVVYSFIRMHQIGVYVGGRLWSPAMYGETCISAQYNAHYSKTINYISTKLHS